MTEPTVPSISCRELYERSRHRPVDLIDVRTPEEFQEVRATIARNVPLDTIDPAKIAARRGATDEPLYLICHLGGRSVMACEMFLTAGYTNVVHVVGGTDAWIEADLPVERGK